MDALTFFGLERTDDPNLWRMPVVPSLISGTGALFGGCGLGAAIEVMEQVTGRPCIWATAQFLSYARPPAVLELEVVEAVRGHQISQARVIARRRRPRDPHRGRRARPAARTRSRASGRPDPTSRRPPTARPRPLMNRHQGTIMDRFESKLADARPYWELTGDRRGRATRRCGSGSPSCPTRRPPRSRSSATSCRSASGRRSANARGGNSLDNTLRVAHRVPTEWVLADVRVHAVADGFGHGLVHLWAEDGTLLGTASQSTIVRVARAGEPRSRRPAPADRARRLPGPRPSRRRPA